MWKVENPHFIDLMIRDALQNIKAFDDGVIIRFLRHVRAGNVADNIQIRLRIINITIHFDGEGVHVNACGDLILDESAADLLNVRDIASYKIVDFVPAHVCGKFFAGGFIYDGFIDDQECFENDRLRGFCGGSRCKCRLRGR